MSTTILTTYEELLYLYLEERAVSLMPSTIVNYKWHLEHFLQALGSSDLTGPAINAFLVDLRTAGKSDHYRRGFHKTIKTWVYWLLDEEYITHNPFRGRGRVQPVPIKRTVRRTYTENEVIRLLTSKPFVTWVKRERRTTRQQWRPDGVCAREDAQGRALVVLLVDSGLRAGEVCRLNCADVWTRDLIVISKGGHQDMAFIGPTTRRLLQEMAMDRPDDAPLFRDGWGKRCSVRALRGILQRIARRADVALPPRPLHSFRHFLAQSLARAKVPDTITQQILRHASVTTTMLYTRMQGEDLARLHAAASPIDRLLALADLRIQPAHTEGDDHHGT